MSRENGRVAGKVAIVTGGASQGPGIGTGQACAKLLAQEGAAVVLANRSPFRAKILAEQIRQEGGECIFIAADVTQAEDVAHLVEATVQHYGKLDIFVSNVGIGATGTVVSLYEADWDEAMDVNLKSMMWCGRYSVPHMMNAGGSIIHISSLAGELACRRPGGMTPYAVSKAGVRGLTLSMAADFAEFGIRVNSLLPGALYTPMVASQLTAAERERRRLATPLRTEGTAWDVGWATVFLASDESRWITGALLPIDGGLMRYQEA